MFSVYSSIISYCAERGCKDLSESHKPKLGQRVDLYIQCLRLLLDGTGSLTPWDRWIKANHMERKWQDAERKKPRKQRIPWEEVLFVSQLALHLYEGSPSLRVPWSFLNSVSGVSIHDSVQIRSLLTSDLPDTLWIEWDGVVQKTAEKPWLSKCIGLLISRMVVFDVPSRIRSVECQEQNERTFVEDMITTLMQSALEEIPCAGYMMIVVQRASDGIHFVPLILGEDQSASIQDMLSVHSEMVIRDARPGTDVAQFFAGIGIRFLLLSAVRDWFPGGRKEVAISSTQLPESRSGSHEFAFANNKLSLRRSSNGDERYVS